MVRETRKRILIVAGRLPIPPLDGGTMRLFGMIRRWKENYSLTLVAPIYKPVSEEVLAVLEADLGAEIHPVPATLHTKSRQIVDSLRQFPKAFPKADLTSELTAYLHDLLSAQPFDVVQFEGSGGGDYLPIVQAILPRPKTVLVFYDVMWDWWRREFLAERRPVALVRWLLYRYWEPRFASSVDVCVFLSKVDQHRVASVARPRHSLIVPNGIVENGDLFKGPQAGPLPRNANVLFVGSFGHLPNVRAAIWLMEKIWPEVQNRIPNARLTIVGRNPTAAMTTLAEKNGVELVPNVPDVGPHYQRCRAVIVPIQTGGGIRIKILEALAQGRPVVTTTIGAEGLPVLPEKHVLFADSPVELATALQRVIEDDHLAEYLVAQGRTLVESEFNWDLLASRQAEAFNHNA